MFRAIDYYPRYRTTPAGKAGVVLPIFVGYDNLSLAFRQWLFVHPACLVDTLFRSYGYDPGPIKEVVTFSLIDPDEIIPGFLITPEHASFTFSYRHVLSVDENRVYMTWVASPHLGADRNIHIYATQEAGRLAQFYDIYFLPPEDNIVEPILYSPELVYPLFTPEEAAESVSKVFGVDKKKLYLFLVSAQSSGVYEKTLLELLTPMQEKEKTLQKMLQSLEEDGIL